MNPSEHRILSVYKKDPNAVLSTTDLVKQVNPDEYQKIESILSDKLSTKELIKKAKRDKAKLHRKLLYYLIKLVDEKVLNIVKQGTKGEKFFTLSLNEGEELVVEKYKKREITISKPRAPSMPTRGYEQSGIVMKLDEPTWIDRLNCIIFEGKVIISTEKLFNIISNSFGLVNDSIGINNFEVFLNSKPEDLIKNLDKLDADCRDFGKKISLIIDISAIIDSDKAISFIKLFAEAKYVNIFLVFELDTKLLRETSSFLEEAAKSLSKGASLFIKNKALVSSPFCFGSGGVYCFSEPDWKEYTKKIQCVSCAQSSLIIDIQKFYSSYGFNNDVFERFMINCAESLLSANSIQRRKAAEFFDYIVELDSPYSQQAFLLSRNYLRFINYEFLAEKFGEDTVFDIIRKIKDKLRDFTFSEETIYKSCGMPTRFKIALASSANISYDDNPESIPLKRVDDLHTDAVKAKLNLFEKKADVFDGGMVVEFLRAGNMEVSDIVHEWNVLLSTYKLPFFAYRFKRLEGVDLNLNDFLGERK